MDGSGNRARKTPGHQTAKMRWWHCSLLLLLWVMIVCLAGRQAGSAAAAVICRNSRKFSPSAFFLSQLVFLSVYRRSPYWSCTSTTVEVEQQQKQQQQTANDAKCEEANDLPEISAPRRSSPLPVKEGSKEMRRRGGGGEGLIPFSADLFPSFSSSYATVAAAAAANAAHHRCCWWWCADVIAKGECKDEQMKRPIAHWQVLCQCTCSSSSSSSRSGSANGNCRQWWHRLLLLLLLRVHLTTH